MENKTQTAVQWFVEQLPLRMKNYMGKEIEQALQMERGQHKTSYKKGAIFNAYTSHFLNGGDGKWDNLPQAFNEYYSETYEK